MGQLIYAGTVDVPLFAQNFDYSVINNAADLWNAITFSNYGLDPLILGACIQLTASVSNIQQKMATVIPAVGGMSSLQFQPDQVGGHQPFGYFDEFLFFGGGNRANFPNGGDITFYENWVVQPRATGVYLGGQIASSTSWFASNVPNQLTNNFPAYYENEPVAMMVYNESDQKSRLRVLNYYEGTTVVDENNWQLGSYAHSGFNSRPMIGTRGNKNSQFPNTLYCSGGSDADGNTIVYYKLTPGFIETQPEHVYFDNPFLDAIFQSASSNGNVSLWYNGFTMVLPAGGIGPTAPQINEIVITDNLMSRYYLVRFQPQDEFTSTLLQQTSLWSFNLDTEGIMWLSANKNTTLYQSQLAYSFSESFPGYPTIVNPPLSPIVLPCWNNCIPAPFKRT